MLELKISNNNVIAGFSTRFGGVSSGVYESLNLSDYVGDDIKLVNQNRKILAHTIGAKKIKFMHQIHSDIVKILIDKNDELDECDAIITTLRGIAICVMVVDCAPVLMYDEKTQTIAAVHAGRAGVMNKICSKTFENMQRNFGSQAQNLKVFVGANIKASCYEIKGVKLGEFQRFKIGDNFDLNGALKAEFNQLGIENVNFDKACTHCDKRYFSYRRDGISGRFVGFIMLK